MKKLLMVVFMLATAMTLAQALPILARGNAYFGGAKFYWATNGWTLTLYYNGSITTADSCTIGDTLTYSGHTVEEDGSYFLFRWGSAISSGEEYEIRATKSGQGTRYGYHLSNGSLDQWWDDVMFYTSPR